MKLSEARVIEEVLAEGLETLPLASTNRPYQMSFFEFKATFAMEAVRLTEFSTVTRHLRVVTWHQFLYETYIEELNNAMLAHLDIPLRVIYDSMYLVDRKSLNSYLKSNGLSMHKLLLMTDDKIDSFTK